MTARYQPASLVRNTVWLCLLMISASLLGAYLKPYLPARLASRLGAVHETVLPARIEAGAQFNLFSEFPGVVRAVLVSPGSRVKKGEAMVQLENTEISTQLANSRRRVEITALRLRDVRAREHSGRGLSAQTERQAAAIRDRDAARDRLQAFSLEQTEGALAAATRRITEIRSLIGQGLATSAELDNARVQEQSAVRDLNTAREHLSRLKQESEQAESQVRLVQVRQETPNPDAFSAEWELEEARSALPVAEGRARRLVVTAPAAGTVIELPVRAGESILSGVPLARIVDLSCLMISAPVSAQIARQIPIGKAVQVRLPTDPPVRLESKVQSVTIAPDSAQRAYLIHASIVNPEPQLVLVGLEAALEFDHLQR